MTHKFLHRHVLMTIVAGLIGLAVWSLAALAQRPAATPTPRGGAGSGEVFSTPTPTPRGGTDSQPTPTPTPTPDDRMKNILKQTRESTERQLNQDGPKVSTSSRNGDFSMTAFISANWPLVIDYRTEEGAVVELYIVTMNDFGFNYMKEKLQGEDIGDGALRAVVRIPERFAQMQPGDITVKAKIKKPEGGSRVAKLSLLSMTCGLSNLRPAPRRRAGGPTFQLLRATFLPDESAIQLLRFSPDEIDSTQGQKIAFSFVPASDFPLWAADFSSITFGMRDGIEIARPRLVFTQKSASEIARGSEVRGEWNGMNRRGRPSVGPHQMAIRAWFTAAGSGVSSYGSSDRMFTVK